MKNKKHKKLQIQLKEKLKRSWEFQNNKDLSNAISRASSDNYINSNQNRI